MNSIVRNDIAQCARPAQGILEDASGFQPVHAARDIVLIIDPACLRLAHRELAERLLKKSGIRVMLKAGRARNPAPSSMELMFQLERLLGRLAGPRLVDRIDRSSFPAAAVEEDKDPDTIIDFCGDETSPTRSRSLRVRYDGIAGEAGLIRALLSGRMPVIEIEEGETGAAVGRAAPCADNASTVLEAFDCVLARLITLLVAVVHNPVAVSSVSRSAPTSQGRSPSMTAFEVKALAYRITRRLYGLCFHSPHWRTCWRFVTDTDVWDTKSLTGTSWQVVPDPGFRFYADPFPFELDGRSYLFVEDLDHRINKGVISVIPFDDRGPSGPAEPVLEEAWHLSYPFLIRHAGEIWMIPESSANRTVTLYRAIDFPYRWVPEAELLSGIEASDATVIFRDGCFWMFAATRDGWGSWSDTLSIFSAHDLRGPWHPHQANPILIDRAAARPAGNMVVRDGRLWRPVQDCTNGYGTGIALAEVLKLDRDGFAQEIKAVLRPDAAWSGPRLHTLNRAGRIECIDGSAYSLRNRALRGRLQKWSGRRDIPQDWPAVGDHLKVDFSGC